ncbi:MAG: hypothetical protein H7274_23475 [Rhodoferax sp.]|nr:hypothetical protein [Rhodoferax sp.]
MGLFATFNHLLNFAAPAFALAVMLPVFARLTTHGKASTQGFALQAMANFVACLAVLLAGLWIGGRDGQMLSYAAMVVVCATTQWLMRRN